jgi:hypothetical protein
MKKFIPDSRNFGGRKVISDQFKNHYENIANAKPTIQTRSKLPASTFTHMNSFWKNNSRKPGESSFHLSKEQKSLLSEHLVNIKHMNRRIKSIGSVKYI